jgi:hypothetical protein
VRARGLFATTQGSEAHFRPRRTATLVYAIPHAAVNEVLRAAAQLQGVCEAQGWRFCVIGGLALLRWGEPRETVDVDLTLLTGFGDEERFIQILLGQFAARLEDAAQFALANRVLLLRSKSGVGLDIALGALPFEESAVLRSSSFAFAIDALIRTCSAEDLVVMKAFAARPKDWIDIEGVIIRQSGKLDWGYIRSQLAPLATLKGSPEILADLERRRSEFEE